MNHQNIIPPIHQSHEDAMHAGKSESKRNANKTSRFVENSSD
jgi:hypothetical protein